MIQFILKGNLLLFQLLLNTFKVILNNFNYKHVTLIEKVNLIKVVDKRICEVSNTREKFVILVRKTMGNQANSFVHFFTTSKLHFNFCKSFELA